MFTVLAVSATQEQQRQVGNPVLKSRSGLRDSMHGTLTWFWYRGGVCVWGVKIVIPPLPVTGNEIPRVVWPIDVS
jgi:hypothetical protein